jgi:hypothetical protein
VNTQTNIAADGEGSEFPRTWRWDDDGDTVEGRFIGFDEGPTAYGDKPIVVLQVDGEPRSLWLFDTALVSKFREEVRKRPTRDLTAGEQLYIKRGGMITSGTGRDYRRYDVRFPDRPKRKAAEILGSRGEQDEVTPDELEDDDLPF